MTDKEIYKLLIQIDNGYAPSYKEQSELENVSEILWNNVAKLPESIVFLKNVTKCSLKNCDILSDISALSGLTALINLDLSGCGSVKDISALSHLTSLINLDLSRCLELKDISALSSLTSLTSFCMRGTRVSDISALCGLTALTNLDLSGCWKLKDINMLSNMTALINLNLRGTMVRDISALRSLTALSNLDLSECMSLTDISALSDLTSLTNLDLSGTSVSNFNALSGLTGLTNLNLVYSGVRDISALASLTGLTNLDLSKNKDLREISAIKGLKKLTNLDLNRTGVSDISALSGLRSLTNLDLAGTRISDISALSSLTALANLDLSGCWKVNDISALCGLTALTNLSLHGTMARDISVLSGLKDLINLDLANTSVSDISVISGLTRLTNLSLHVTNVSDISALSSLTGLDFLDLSDCNAIKDISTLSRLTSLETLDLSNTSVSDISAISELTALKYLDLAGTRVSDINALSGLTALTFLNLRVLHLNNIPEWILDLDLDFLPRQYPYREGIIIDGLRLDEQPIEIFSQDRKLIRAYYRSQDKVPINECKVIFLGDAEAGKTHSIKRLLQKGEKLTNFDGNSTPGIEITISSTIIEGTDTVINYWDFGGQEIQHSMHRMFLTQRTVYVVFLNARQDPLDDRARYWIENIKSFAPGTPILLVINKIDQNSQPKFNEYGIRDAYKDQIKDVVRMSALKDDSGVFMNKLQGSINEIVKQLPTASTMVPKAWKSLMEDLRSTPEHYLMKDQFIKKCVSNYVYDYDKIHSFLVNLFQDIGVSFCYSEDRSTADYILLNPKWLVNALYTIVTNSKDITSNGVITQADLYDVLLKDYIKGIPIKRVVPKWRYEGVQVNYVLGVLRRFRLSYQLKDGAEFFPMLCDGNEKISVSKAVSPDALHYVFRYTYLPANVLHRLIVEKQRELDYNYVWYSGAVFRNREQHQTAYVHSIGNKIHIYVDCKDSFYNPNEYLTPILNEIRGINQEMGLQAKELIGIQRNGNEAEVPFDSLKGNLEAGNKKFYVSQEIGVVGINEILFRYNDRRPRDNRKLFKIIIQALEEMQNEPNFYTKDENSRNRFVSQQLRSAGYYCNDQVPGGISTTGKSIGLRDGVIKDANNHDISIFEGLNLNSLVKATINAHLDKLLVNYNPQGLPYGFMLVYLDCPRENYGGFIDKYKDYINNYAPDTYECVSAPTIVSAPTNGQLLTCIRMDYECGRDYYTIYHIVVRVAAL